MLWGYILVDQGYLVNATEDIGGGLRLNQLRPVFAVLMRKIGHDLACLARRFFLHFKQLA